MVVGVAGRIRFARALRSRNFALLWTGQTISVFGDQAFLVTLAWSVLQLTGSAAALAVVLIAQSVPRLVFLLIGGVVADRLPRRLIMFSSDGIRAVAVLVIAFLFWWHLAVLWDLIGLAILFGIGDAFFAPAYQAIPPQLVPSDDLASANSLTVLSRQGGMLIGPAIGATLFALTGPAAAMAFDGLTFLISASCLIAMRMPSVSPADQPGPTPSLPAGAAPARRSGLARMLTDVGEGFAILFGSSWLFVGTFVSATGNVGIDTLSVSLPKLIRSEYGEGVWLLGAVLSASAFGSIIASILIGQAKTLRHRGVTAYLAATLTCVALGELGLMVPQRFLVFTLLCEGTVIGFGLGIFGVVYYTTLQQLVPEDKLGRVSSIDWLGSYALQPLGLALIGTFTDRWGPSPVFVVAGVVNCLLFLGALSFRGVRNVDQFLRVEGGAAPAVSMASLLESGPPTFPSMKMVAPVPEPVRCLHSQERLWSLYQQHPGSAGSHVVSAHSISGALDIGALSGSIQALVDRHEALRTHFVATTGMPKQVILQTLRMPHMDIEDLSDLTPVARDTAVRRWSEETAQLPFDLENGPLLRARLLRLASDQYALILVFDCLICDSWSASVLAHELEQLYPVAREGVGRSQLATSLPLPKITYREYSTMKQFDAALDTARLPSASAREDSLRYWSERLHNAPARLNLPRDCIGIPQGSGLSGAHSVFTLPDQQSILVAQWCQQQRVSIAAALLAAWAGVLSRYCIQDDVVMDYPLSERDSDDEMGLCAPLSNPAVLRLSVSDRVTFQELVQQGQVLLEQAVAHGPVPCGAMVETSEQYSALSRRGATPSNVAFSVDRSIAQPLQLSGLRCGVLEVETGSATADLRLDCRQEGSAIQGCIEYRTGLFSATFIEHLIQHFQILLRSGLADPDALVIDLPLLSATERETVLRRWNQTWRALPEGRLIQDYIIEQVRLQPQALAVVVDEPTGIVTLTYSELFARAAELATWLRASGVTVDTPVAVLFERSTAWVIAQLATLLAGGYFISVDPGQPAERIRTIFREAKPISVVTTPHLMAKLRSEEEGMPLPSTVEFMGIMIHCIYLDVRSGMVLTDQEPRLASPSTVATRDGSGSQQHDAEILAGVSLKTAYRHILFEDQLGTVRPSGQNLAYCVFTSGSTGVPKGVCLTHVGLLNAALWWCDSFDVRSTDHCTCLAGLGFDATIIEIWPTLTAGACLYLVDDLTRLDTEQLQQFLLAKEITVSFIPTPLCERLLNLPWPTDTALRIMATGGDRLHAFVPHGVPFSVYNAYGPSETTVAATFGPVPLETEAQARGLVVPTIGSPIANSQVYVLDSHLHPVPLGIPGELYIGGINVGRGYLNRPELTSERFIPNPFSDASANGTLGEPGSENLYRSGDVVQQGLDGELHFIGRADTQIKIRGFRIEPGEIEATLMLHPRVRAALVVALDRESYPGSKVSTSATASWSGTNSPGGGNHSTDQQLVAVVELREQVQEELPVRDELHQLLLQQLPRYMIPTRIEFVEHVALTRNGKPDRGEALRLFHEGMSARELVISSVR